MGFGAGLIVGLVIGWQFYYGEKMIRQHTEDVNKRLKQDTNFWQKYSRKLEKKLHNEKPTEEV